MIASRLASRAEVAEHIAKTGVCLYGLPSVFLAKSGGVSYRDDDPRLRF